MGIETGVNHDNAKTRMEEMHGKKGNNPDIPAQGENVDNPNKRNIDNSTTTENPNTVTQEKIAKIHGAEAKDKSEEHPTPEEILAQLEGGSMASMAHEAPNSSLGGASAAEGANREAIHT